jgi:hypothetical protein
MIFSVNYLSRRMAYDIIQASEEKAAIFVGCFLLLIMVLDR